MSHNYYSELHIHVTWHTAGNRPLLVPAVESQVHHTLRERCRETDGVIVHAVNGTPDHVHLCLTIPPTVTISSFVGQLKGASSYFINHSNLTRDKLLEWQTGYGAVSFGTKDLPWVQKYVDDQKERHRVGRVHARLEGVIEIESPMNGADFA